MTKSINVLSPFDGISCAQIALKNLGIKVDRYYSSEIDKYAIQITQKNFPDTIQLGDIKDIKGEDLPEIDLIVAGSPCQGFSFAGKQLAFDDPRSALFFEFVRLLKEIKPKYFLLENVVMRKEFRQVITDEIRKIYPQSSNGNLFGIEPIMINSALLSAQNRKRLYWTNIPNIEQPEDLGIVLRDVLDYKPEEFTKMSDNFLKRNGERDCMIDDTKEKAHSFSAMDYVKNGRQGNYLACDNEGRPTYNKPKKVGMNVEQVKVRRHEVDIEELQLYILKYFKESGKTKKDVASELGDKFTTVEHYFRSIGSQYFAIPSEEHWPKLKKILNINDDTWDARIMEFEYRDGVYETKQRVYTEDGKSPTLTSSNKEQYVAVKGGAIRARSKDSKGKHVGWKETKPKQVLEIRKDDKSNSLTSATKDSVAVKEEEQTWRKLTCLECERLQTVPDNYTEGVSNTQRYKMLGNGFTVKVIEHILKNMEL